jgi:tRNA A37 methylthiotransferase MiaB
VGFPGETAADLRELELFLSEARLDAIGIFGYSDEDGTEAATLPGKVAEDEDEVARRVSEFADLAEEIMAQRAADRVGTDVDVLVEAAETEATPAQESDGRYEGRAAHQAPEVDGSVTLLSDRPLRPGDLVKARVIESAGADLVARA